MLVSIVVPVYNEASGLLEFHRRLDQTLSALPHKSEIWFVDDGSTDTTVSVVRDLMQRDTRVGLIELSRNFGHQLALTAGLDFADGDVVICMDGDGQHPPNLIPAMLALYEQGFDVVLTQRRTSGESFLKRWTSRMFYWLANFLSDTPVLPASADFRLLSHKVVLALRRTREYHRFLRGLVNWAGFRHTVIAFDPFPRIAGRSKYSTRRMFKLASDAIFSFSTAPLKLATLLGFGFLLLAFLQLGRTTCLMLMGRHSEWPPGWTPLMFSVLGAAGVQLVILGMIGQYVGMIFLEVKKRPLYFLRDAPTCPAAWKDELKVTNGKARDDSCSRGAS